MMMSEILQKTILHPQHLALNARMVGFGGWDMPIQYTGIRQEHLSVRSSGGLFDISHMGEFLVEGPGACDFLRRCLTNNPDNLSVGMGQYTLMCDHQGGTIDDLYLYRTREDAFLMMVNASRIMDDWQWLKAQCQSLVAEPDSVHCENLSDQLGALACQGPAARQVIGRMEGEETQPIAHMAKNQIQLTHWQGTPIWVAVTGYTGEDGYELIAPNSVIPAIWAWILEQGQAAEIIPAGLGARDTLRTEMGYPLYGHELSPEISPLEAGLGFFVDFNKGEFTGRQAMLEARERGLSKRSVAFLMDGKAAPPRAGYRVADQAGNLLGLVTSGTMSPSLEKGLGLAILEGEAKKPGEGIQIEIRQRWHPATVVRKPMYRKA